MTAVGLRTPEAPDCHALAMEWRQTTFMRALPVGPDGGLIGGTCLRMSALRTCSEPGIVMKFVHSFGLAIAALVLLVHPASAQSTPGMAIPLNSEDAKSPEEMEKQRRIDDDYKATMKKIPDAKANDPWGNMRSADTSTQAKPTQLKPKSTAQKKKTGNVAD
jgi:hypothetical protein